MNRYLKEYNLRDLPEIPLLLFGCYMPHPTNTTGGPPASTPCIPFTTQTLNRTKGL